MKSYKDYYQLYLKYKSKYLAEKARQRGGLGEKIYTYTPTKDITFKFKDATKITLNTNTNYKIISIVTRAECGEKISKIIRVFDNNMIADFSNTINLICIKDLEQDKLKLDTPIESLYVAHAPAFTSISYCINKEKSLIYSYNKINDERMLINIYTIKNKVITADGEKLGTIYYITQIPKTNVHRLDSTCINVASTNINIIS